MGDLLSYCVTFFFRSTMNFHQVWRRNRHTGMAKGGSCDATEVGQKLVRQRQSKYAVNNDYE
ncbi:MAG: hypothetical protein ABI209_11910 [Edaphobacter sp.]